MPWVARAEASALESWPVNPSTVIILVTEPGQEVRPATGFGDALQVQFREGEFSREQAEAVVRFALKHRGMTLHGPKNVMGKNILVCGEASRSNAIAEVLLREFYDYEDQRHFEKAPSNNNVLFWMLIAMYDATSETVNFSDIIASLLTKKHAPQAKE